MLTWQELYPPITLWLQAIGLPAHATARDALAQLLVALLQAQSLRLTAVMRAYLSPKPVPARQRYKRLSRALERRWLSSQWLTPYLVRVAVALVAPERWTGRYALILDSVRCGSWELYVLGLAWHGRVLPVAWIPLPYPLPKGRFGPTVLALIERVAAAWPAGQPVVLLADRAFPSQYLFARLRQLGWDWVVRVRATDGVQLATGEYRVVRALLAAAHLGSWSRQAARFGAGQQAVPGWLVIGRGLTVIPAHQRGPGSLHHRGEQQRRRQRHLDTKKPAGSTAQLRQTDPWVALFSSLSDARQGESAYAGRYHIEGTFRDAQSGWDGQHGWNLEPVLARPNSAERVDRIAGLWALGTLVQSWIGDQVGAADVPPLVRQIRRQWTTTGRLSVMARGRLALTDQSGLLTGWLLERLGDGAGELAGKLREVPPTAQPERKAA